MNTTTETAEHRMVDARLIFDDKNQPRKIFEAESLNELAADIKVRGLIQPIIIREDEDRSVILPKELAKETCYAIVCGARRFRAAMIAGLDEVPCIIRSLTDNEALEFQISENLNREDINPMEESDAFQQLVHRGIKTPEMIADKFGVSVKYVYDRLTIQKVVPEVQEAVREGRLSITHAKQFARLPMFDQAKLVKEIDLNDTTLTVADIRDEINSMFKLKLDRAVFDTKDAKLVKGAVACEKCKKRTGCNLLLFEEVQTEDICLDSACWDAKLNAHIQLTIEKYKDAGKEVKLISAGWNTKGENLLSRNQWDKSDTPTNTIGIFMEVSPYNSEQVGEVIDLEEIEEEEEGNSKSDWKPENTSTPYINYGEIFAKKCIEKAIELFLNNENFPHLPAMVILQEIALGKFVRLQTSTCECLFDYLRIAKINDEMGADDRPNIPALHEYLSKIDEQDLRKFIVLMEQLDKIEAFDSLAHQSQIEEVSKSLENTNIDFFEIAKEIGSPNPLFTPTNSAD